MKQIFTILLLTLTIICLLGCNSSPNSGGTEKVKALKESSTKVNEIQIQVIEKWPDEIDGCSCYFSRNKDEFRKREYIYMDDYGVLAFMKINGRNQRFKLTKSDTLASSDEARETWSNEMFELTIETHQIGQIEETWQHKGKLTVKSNDGEVVEQEIYGECGC